MVVGDDLRPKVANNIDHKEDGALGRLHCKVAASSIAFNRVICGSLDEKVKDSLRRAQSVAGGIGGESEDQNDDQ